MYSENIYIAENIELTDLAEQNANEEQNSIEIPPAPEANQMPVVEVPAGSVQGNTKTEAMQNFSLILAAVIIIFIIVFVLIILLIKLKSDSSKQVKGQSVTKVTKIKAENQVNKPIKEQKTDAVEENQNISNEKTEEETFEQKIKKISVQLGTPNNIERCIKSFLEITKE